jgi:hypothetical protein
MLGFEPANFLDEARAIQIVLGFDFLAFGAQ